MPIGTVLAKNPTVDRFTHVCPLSLMPAVLCSNRGAGKASLEGVEQEMTGEVRTYGDSCSN